MITAIVCHKTHDGRLFEDESKARAHSEDLLGAELDGLLRLAGLNITRNQEYNALIKWMKQRGELSEAIKAVHSLLTYGDDTA